MIKKICIIIATTFILTFNTHAFTDKLYNDAEALKNASISTDTDSAVQWASTASEALKPKNILVHMTDSLKETLSGSNKNLITILAVIILCALTEVFNKNLGSCNGIIDYVSLFSLMLICFDMLTPLISSISDYLDKHTAFMLSVAGTSSTVIAASGSVSTATVSSASASFITAFTQVCSVNVILPAVKIIIVLSSVGAISKNMDLSGIINFLKSFCSYGTGLLFAVFLAVHSLAVSISASSDSLAFRSLRFTFSRLIPVAGSMISESIKTVMAGMDMIKNAAGGIGTAYIIYTLIPAVFSVLSVKLTVIAALLVSKLFGTKKHTAFLDGINNACTLLFSICIFAAFAGIIILAVFMKTTVNV